MMNRKVVRKQEGFSLIELMIAMLLGTFLIGGLLSVFISSAGNYKVQQALTEVQHKGRYIMRMLRQDVQGAGFDLDADDIVRPAVQEFIGAAGSCAPGRRTFEIYWNEGDPLLTASRRRFCYYVTDQNVLMRRLVTGVSAPSAATELEIATGVEDWQLSYAVDNDQLGVIDQVSVAGNNITYIPSGSLVLETAVPQPLATATWQEVRAVRLDVLVRSNTQNVTSQLQQIGAPFARQATDNNLYQIFSATLALRNRIE
ncbi:MAG: hypothetical protein OFPI_06290 [Osedax symbiont Rs2]|nr:MAG: hypothetical protein OFPI_06290 [Osedax symbiont Rs2]